MDEPIGYIHIYGVENESIEAELICDDFEGILVKHPRMIQVISFLRNWDHDRGKRAEADPEDVRRAVDRLNAGKWFFLTLSLWGEESSEGG